MDVYFRLAAVLSPREIALLAWMFVFTIWALTRAQIRRSVLGVLRALVRPEVLEVEE